MLYRALRHLIAVKIHCVDYTSHNRFFHLRFCSGQVPYEIRQG